MPRSSNISSRGEGSEEIGSTNRRVGDGLRRKAMAFVPDGLAHARVNVTVPSAGHVRIPYGVNGRQGLDRTTPVMIWPVRQFHRNKVSLGVDIDDLAH